MKQLYLIRHAKSSWSYPDLSDFDRPLNKRGKRNGPEMANRLQLAGIIPDVIVSSPAKRARKTARMIAKGVGCDPKGIRYFDELYFGSIASHIVLIDDCLGSYDSMFLIGHNHVLTELGEYLTGSNLGNVPTSGIVAIDYSTKKGFAPTEGKGKLRFFDYPKNRAGARVDSGG